jgi:hypothetical protein
VSLDPSILIFNFSRIDDKVEQREVEPYKVFEPTNWIREADSRRIKGV